MGRSLAGAGAPVPRAASGIGWGMGPQTGARGGKGGAVSPRARALGGVEKNNAPKKRAPPAAPPPAGGPGPREELEKLTATKGGTAAAAAADVGDRAQVESAVRCIRERLGPIDLVIANAGFGKATLLDPVNMADVEQTFRVNLLGVVYTLSA